MEKLDYTYNFAPIEDKGSEVQIIDHNNKSSKSKQSIETTIRDYDLLIRGGKRIPSLAADLIDIATAVHLADRISIRHEDMPCRIEINLSVRHPEIFSKPAIIQKLQNILAWFTDDHWFFHFRQYDKFGRLSETQIPLYEEKPNSVKIALWSGGLDSLSGLYQQLQADTNCNFILLGGGSNQIIYHLQNIVHNCIRERFPKRTTLIRTPIRTNNTRMRSKNSSQRARGFVFMLQGIACSYALGENILYLYENGIGAINLPYTKAEIGLDHSRSVHPISLYYMSELASLIFESNFCVSNPFIFNTKAEMCKELLQNNDLNLAFKTVTCDSRHRRKISQCGYCSSCLLRRQAIAALQFEDQTKYVITDEQNRLKKPSDSIYLIAMLSQVEDLRTLLRNSDPWASMTQRYQWLQETVDRTWQKEGITKDAMIEKLIQMYRNYVQEWDIALPTIRLGLLEDTNVVL